MGSTETSEQSGWHDEGLEGSHPRRHRPPPRATPWFRIVVALALCALLVWVSGQPGGIRARISGVEKSITGTVSNLTQNRELEKATKTFNGWYDQRHQYPNYTQSQLDEQVDGSWGAGMDVSWCTARDVVLTSLTAAGTVSRLLIDGKKVGRDLPGRVGCPADLVNPTPWKR